MGGRRDDFVRCLAIYAVTVVLWNAALSALTPSPGAELPQLKLTAEPRIGFAKAAITVTVLARPDDANRIFALSIGAPDSGFAASTQRTIDGENERGELARIVYKDVPAGNYLVVAALFNRDGKPLASRSVGVRRLARMD